MMKNRGGVLPGGQSWKKGAALCPEGYPLFAGPSHIVNDAASSVAITPASLHLPLTLEAACIGAQI